MVVRSEALPSAQLLVRIEPRERRFRVVVAALLAVEAIWLAAITAAVYGVAF